MISAGGDDRPPIRVVLADANVLYSRVLGDYTLYAAVQGALEIRWSAAILAEVVAHLTENIAGFDAAAGARLVTAMNAAVRAAEVEPDADAVEAVADLRLPDEDDRHVLAAAAAVAVQADVLSTDILKDFPTDTMNEAGIQLISADALLSLLVMDFPEEMVDASWYVTPAGLSGSIDTRASADSVKPPLSARLSPYTWSHDGTG